MLYSAATIRQTQPSLAVVPDYKGNVYSYMKIENSVIIIHTLFQQRPSDVKLQITTGKKHKAWYLASNRL